MLLLPLLTATACFGPAGGTPSAPTLGPGGAATATLSASPAAGTQAPPSPTVAPPASATAEAVDQIEAEGDLTLGPGTFDFPDPTVGLADLESYQATLTLSFAGTEAGQPSTWTRTYVLRSTRTPLVRILNTNASGVPDEAEPLLQAEAQGAAYEQLGDGACMAEALDLAVPLLEPAALLTGVLGADDAGLGTLGDLAVTHATFDERAVAEAGLTSAAGELWVAADGGYLAQYHLATQAGADYLGEGIEGTLTWDYALAQINQPLDLALPAGCPAGMLDAPLMPDAADVVNEPGLLSFTTAAAPADVAAFYQAQLPPLGWQPTGTDLISNNLALLDFTRGGQLLSLTITLSDLGSDVLLVVEPSAP
jgi:hypothetical protein